MTNFIKPFKAPKHIFDYDDEYLNFDDAKALSPIIKGDRIICVDGVFHSEHGRPIRNRKLCFELEKISILSKEEGIVIDFVIKYKEEFDEPVVNMGFFFPEEYRIYIIDSMSSKVYDAQSKGVNLETRIEFSEKLATIFQDSLPVRVLPYKRIGSKEEAIELHEAYSKKGHHQIILRALHIDTCKRMLVGGWYKHGRASKNQKMLWKMKLGE